MITPIPGLLELSEVSALTWAALVVVIVLAVVTGIALWRQGYPESGPSDPSAESGRGPTGEDYPPGSRPAGPGAEPMNEKPSSQEEQA